MKTRIITLVLLTFFWLCLSHAQAVPITIQISGEITSLGGYTDPIPDTIYAGVPFTGTYTYDSSTLDSDSDPLRGKYLHDSPYGISISIGGYEFKTAPSHTDQFRIRIYNDLLDDGINDSYAVISEYENVSEPFVDFEVHHISWYLKDSTHTAIDSDALPLTAPVLEDWDYNVLTIFCLYGPNYTGLSITGTVTQAIPEPTTGIILLVGSFVLRGKKIKSA